MSGKGKLALFSHFLAQRSEAKWPYNPEGKLKKNKKANESVIKTNKVERAYRPSPFQNEMTKRNRGFISVNIYIIRSQSIPMFYAIG